MKNQKHTDTMKLNFTADKHSVTEGDVIELNWQVPEGEGLSLTIDNGFKSQTLPIDSHSGSKKFRLNRSQGKTKLTLSATHNGKTTTETIKVKVKKMKVTHAETIYEERKHRNPFRKGQNTTGKTGEWINNQRNRFSYNWSLLTPQKKMAYIIIGIMATGLLLSCLTGKDLMMLTDGVMMGYLAYILIKR